VPNNYDFRLLVDRELYDGAVFTAHSPAMADLARGAAISINPWDADRHGVTEGTPVQVIAPRTTVVLPARPDARVPRGIARLVFNQPDGAASELVDVNLPVNDVRIEVV
jgi:anaerobic selenocysteine-containing dehydrogenase